MQLYWEIAGREYRRHMTYRAALLAGLATNLGFGVMRVAVLLALLGERSDAAGYDANDLISYVALTQAVIAYLSLFSWYELMNTIYTGEISGDLLKPVSFLSLWLARDIGRALVHFLMRGLLFMVCFELIYQLAYPQGWWQWLAVLMALINGLLISFGWRFIINAAAFWTPQALGFVRVGFIISWFFSGFLMPLSFLPDWVQQLANWTPFPHMLNSIVELYTGLVSGGEALGLLLSQLAWAAGLLLLAQLLLRLGLRRLVILGG